jgi:hypothetical protein
MNESDLLILQKSLKVISDFEDRIVAVNSAKEFLDIHNRNLKMLKELASDRKSDFIKKRITEFPNITEAELDLYIANNKKETSLLKLVGGVLIDSIYNLIKTKGSTPSQIKNKLLEIKGLNERLIKVVEDPIYEELYEKTTYNSRL